MTFNCSEISLTISGTNIKVKKKKKKKLTSVHILGDFNLSDMDWPDRLNKTGSVLSQSEGQMLIDTMNDHGLEQLVYFPPREKNNTLDLLLTSLPGGARWLSGRVSDSGARGPGFETYRRRVVSLSKTL